MRRIIFVAIIALTGFIPILAHTVRNVSSTSGESVFSADAPSKSVEYVEDGAIITLEFPSFKLTSNNKNEVCRWKIDGFMKSEKKADQPCFLVVTCFIFLKDLMLMLKS